MSRLRHSTITIAVLGLLVAALTLVAAPATAKDTEFFVFANAMTNPDADNDGEPDMQWQVRATVTPLGSCVPERGATTYDSYWLDAGEAIGATLSPTECVFRISAKARVESNPDCVYPAQIAWATDDGRVVGSYHDDSLLTSSRATDESRLAIRSNPDGACSRPHRTYFLLGGDAMVEELPGAIPDPDLQARARRAAAVGEYTVRVSPESTDTRATGCDIGAEFTLNGDRSRSAQVLGATGDRCPSRAAIVAAPAHVKVAEGDYVSFDAALPNIIVDLTPLLRIESARIAIIQDVAGSANRGEVSYTITRTCGGAELASPPAQATSSELFEGRFTVHSPDIPQFGPVGIYPAVATSATSSVVVGCAVTVAVSGVPSACTVTGGSSRTLAWSATNPIRHFDFEFDIACGEAPLPDSTVPESPPADQGPIPAAEDMVPADANATPADGGATNGGEMGEAQDAQPPAEPSGPPRDAPTG